MAFFIVPAGDSVGLRLYFAAMQQKMLANVG
jgi:hypothetical protein